MEIATIKMTKEINNREKLDNLYDFNIFNWFYLLSKIKIKNSFDIFLLIICCKNLTNETHIFIFHFGLNSFIGLIVDRPIHPSRRIIREDVIKPRIGWSLAFIQW